MTRLHFFLVACWMLSFAPAHAQVPIGKLQRDGAAFNAQNAEAAEAANLSAKGRTFKPDGRATFIEILQIVDEKNAIVIVKHSFGKNLMHQARANMWLEAPMEGRIDGEMYEDDHLFEVLGTKRYSAVSGGSNTVPHAKLVSAERLAELKKVEEAKAEAERKAAEEKRIAAEAENARLAAEAEAALWRTWKDSTGSKSVKAKFLTFKDNRVQLMREDNGKTIEMPMTQLSKDDQQWIRTELKSRKKAEPSGTGAP